MYNGQAHEVSADYLSDNGTGITSIWETIETNLGMPSTFKTVYRAALRYVDKTSDTPISVSVSNDGGVSWMPSSKTVGDGDGKTKTKLYFFRDMSGENFKFKIESASTAKEFQIIGLDIDFEPGGDTVDV